MPAGNLDIYIEQGTTFSQKLTIRNPGNPPTPIDLTAYTFEGQIRKRFNSSDILASFTITLADQVTNPGELTLSLTDTQTSDIPADSKISNYAYDVEAAFGGVKTRIISGVIFLSSEVTR